MKGRSKLKEEAAALSKGIASDGFVGALRQFGTSIIVMITNSAGAFPRRITRSGNLTRPNHLRRVHGRMS